VLKFLNPTAEKILLAAGLFYGSSAVWRAYVVSRISDTFPQGFPFQFYVGWGLCPPGQTCSTFNGWFLVLDIVLWYIVSAFILNSLRKKG
jgi:hypothetical protein